MALGTRRFTTGIQLIPNHTVPITISGELAYNDTTATLQLFGATAIENVVTDTNGITVSNKTFTNPVLNGATADTITGISGGALTLNAATNQNITLVSNGVGVILLDSISVKTNTITGAAGSAFTVQSGNNQNLVLNAQGTGNTLIESLTISEDSITGDASAPLSLNSGTGQNVVVNAASGALINLQVAGTTELQVTGSAISLNLPTTVTGALIVTSTISGTAATLTNTTNQIVLGTTHTVTIDSIAPAASRIYTIPDAGTNSSFLMADGNQTVNGNQDFTGNLTIENPLTLTEVTTPSNPSTGHLKVYAKSDDKLYTLNSGGTETQVGSGSGGGGGTNYVLNPGFEANTTGWAAYANTAQVQPVNGTGGSPVVTITRTTTNPLIGAASGLITKDAANRQGNGVSYDFTIDPAYQAQVLSIQFNYEVASGTFNAGSPSTDSDLEMWVYDKTNAVLIPVTPYKLASNSSITPSIFAGTFQTNSNSTSYRFIMHVATTNAAAWTFEFDNVMVGPQSILQAPSVSDWVAYTPTITGFGTPSAVSFFSRRVGDSLEVHGAFTAGTPSGSNAAVSIGYNGTNGNASIDTTKLASTKQLLGKAGVDENSATIFDWDVVYGTATTVYLGIQNSTTPGINVPVGGNTISGTSNVVTMFFTVPITGWSSNTVTGNDADSRVIAARLSRAATESVPNNTLTTVNYDTIDFDTAGGASVPAGTYTIPVSGYYDINIISEFNNTSTTGLRATYLFINGVLTNVLGFNAPGTVGSGNSTIQNGSIVIKAQAGDVISVEVQQQSGGSILIAPSGSSANQLAITKVSGPALPLATDVVAARVMKSAAQSIPNGSATQVQYDTKDYDTHNAFDVSSTFQYTVPVSGFYRLASNLDFATNTTGQRAAQVLKNGTFIVEIGQDSNPGSAATSRVPGSTTLQLVAGDVIAIAAFQSSGGALNIAPNGVMYTYFSIDRI